MLKLSRVVALACLALVSAALAAEPRTALVIGNAAYSSSPLTNPVNDATAIAQALREEGFEVIERSNADRKQMLDAVRMFGDKIRGGGVALFYYAGHGIQIKGRNYLIPVDADIRSEDEVEFESLDASQVLAKMDQARTRINIVILDACRNNPFARSFRSSQAGLAKMDAPKGTLLAYATAPDSVAGDGARDHGVYTEALLRHMRKPGLAIEQLFRNVRIDVMRATDERQIPWESTSLTGDFFFTPSGSPETSSAAPQPTLAPLLLPLPLPQPTLVPPSQLFPTSAGLPEMIWIPGGGFSMGCSLGDSACQPGEFPTHAVQVSGFWMSRTEITNRQWWAFVQATGYRSSAEREGVGWGSTNAGWQWVAGLDWRHPFVTGSEWAPPDNPVIQISWDDAVQYCMWLNQAAPPQGYRLPTEAEWEYAARAGVTTAWPANLDASAWFGDNTGSQRLDSQSLWNWAQSYDRYTPYLSQNRNTLHPVGTKLPNAFGLQDMLGGVWEWCHDAYKEDAYLGQDGAINPSVPWDASPSRAFRGGGWSSPPLSLRFSTRAGQPSGFRDSSLGFRVVRVAS